MDHGVDVQPPVASEDRQEDVPVSGMLVVVPVLVLHLNQNHAANQSVSLSFVFDPIRNKVLNTYSQSNHFMHGLRFRLLNGYKDFPPLKKTHGKPACHAES